MNLKSYPATIEIQRSYTKTASGVRTLYIYNKKLIKLLINLK